MISESGCYNYSSYVCVEDGLWIPVKKQLNRFRKNVLELPPLQGIHSLLHERKVPCLYSWSPLVLPKPDDWMPHLHVTGYWFLDTTVDKQWWTPSNEIIKFVKQKPKPLYIGFGSMTANNSTYSSIMQVMFEALILTGQRAIVMRGDMGNHHHYPPNVFVVDSIPHDWLFPQVAAVIHHGGAGTTAAGLRAGVPTMIVPFFGDQFFWANQIEKLGVGVPYIVPQQLTPDNVSRSIIRLLNDEQMIKFARVLGTQIRQENGVTRALQVFHRELKQYREKQFDTI